MGVTEKELMNADDRQEQGTSNTSDRDSFADSASSRGFRSEENYYTQAQDQAIINFILDNGRCKDTGGVALWQEMVEGKSWRSMKERFKRSIVKRLDLFGLDDQQEEQ